MYWMNSIMLQWQNSPSGLLAWFFQRWEFHNKLTSSRFWEHFRYYTQGIPKSKFAEHLLCSHHSISHIDAIMQPLYYTTKGRLMNTVEKYFIYLETKLYNQLNGRHTIQPNAIFGSLLHIHSHRGHSLPLQPNPLNKSTTLTTVPHTFPDKNSSSSQHNLHVSNEPTQIYDIIYLLPTICIPFYILFHIFPLFVLLD
jgi:hypothetical protein